MRVAVPHAREVCEVREQPTGPDKAPEGAQEVNVYVVARMGPQGAVGVFPSREEAEMFCLRGNALLRERGVEPDFRTIQVPSEALGDVGTMKLPCRRA